MNKLDVYLLPDRSIHGKAIYRYASGIWEFPILGKADNNRARARKPRPRVYVKH